MKDRQSNGNNVAGPSVVKRIKMAVDIGFGTGSIDERICNIADIIGTGLHVSVDSSYSFWNNRCLFRRFDEIY